MPPILSLPLSMPCDDCDGCVTIGGSSKVICGGLIMQKIHGLSLFEGDDDNCLFTVLGLPTPASWQGDHTQIVVATMVGVWHASTREVILGTENGKLHEIVVDEKVKRGKYIKFLFELSEYPEAFEGLQMETASMGNVTIYYVMAVTPTRLYSFTGIGTPEVDVPDVGDFMRLRRMTLTGCEVHECGSAWKIRLLMRLSSFLHKRGSLRCIFNPAIADILIEELIEKVDGFAGVFPGSDITVMTTDRIHGRKVIEATLKTPNLLHQLSVSPRAQMNQQWFRQFKAAKDALDTDMQDETNSKVKDREEDQKRHTIAHAIETQNMLALELDFTLNATTRIMTWIFKIGADSENWELIWNFCDVKSADKPGLLAEVTRTCMENSMNVTEAEISVATGMAQNIFLCNECNWIGKGYGFVRFANRSTEDAIQNMRGILISKQTVRIS
ncbi:vacuolar protein sorting-associated protein 18 [Tanacetum coccineum]